MTRTLLVAAAFLLPLASVPFASAGIDLCPEGGRLCVEREGACLSAVYHFTYDFGAGGASCATASAGPEGAAACENAWAGAGGWSGFFGAIVGACAEVDGQGNGCVAPRLQVNEDPGNLEPLCTA